MPSHPDRVRSVPLPEGYQFGDGRKVSFQKAWDAAGPNRWLLLEPPARWRSLHENNAEQFARRQRSPGWNTIEPDEHV